MAVSQLAAATTYNITNAGITIGANTFAWVVARGPAAPPGWTQPSNDANYNADNGFVAPISTNWAVFPNGGCYNANGIWYPITNNPPTGWTANDSVPVYFRLAFNLPNNAVVTAAFDIFIDDQSTIYINGHVLGGGLYNQQEEVLQAADIIPYLQCGENVIAIEGLNTEPPCYMLNVFANTYITVDSTRQSFMVQAQAVNVSCNGAGNGVVNTVTTSGTAPFSYTWQVGVIPGNQSTAVNLAPGQYTVSVTDTAGCSATATANITQPPLLTATATADTPACGLANAQVTILAAGGTPAYTFTLNGVTQTTNVFTGQAAGGPYQVKVQDDSGCNATASVLVAAHTGPVAVLIPTNPVCGLANGKITVQAAGGTAPYSFTLNNSSPQAADSFANLGGGNYIIQITDAGNCITADTVTLKSSTNVALALIADSENCFNGNTGVLTAIVTGGTWPYNYSLNGGAALPGNQFTQLSAGSYTVMVTDANGCSSNATAFVFQPNALMADSLVAVPVLCAGEQNGKVIVYASGGTAPYTYAATETGGNFISTANSVLQGLDTGLYTIQIADSRGCTVTDTITVPGAVADSFNILPVASCPPPVNNGVVNIIPLTNAGAPYTYSIANNVFQNSGLFDSLPAASYYPVVKNMSGCIFNLGKTTVTAAAPALLNIYPADTTVTPGSEIAVTTTFAPYGDSNIIAYLWTPPTGLSCTNCASPVVTAPANASTYYLTVTYNNGCTETAEVYIDITDNAGIFIPNAFTPDNDGNNDEFYVYTLPGTTLLSFKIFDRWGEKVHDGLYPWNGTYKGKPCPVAVYVYVVELEDAGNFTVLLKKGSVTLLR